MQWIVMVTSVIASAFISYLIAKKQLNHAIIQEYKAQLKYDQELFAQWIVDSSDMIAALSNKSPGSIDHYYSAEHHLEKQMALIGLEYHEPKYNHLVEELRTFITDAHHIFHQKVDAISIEELVVSQRELNNQIRALIAKQWQEVAGK